MSPEQLRSEELDPRTDLFSFGVVLYEMLSGEQPFTGASPGEVRRAILERDPPPLPPTVPAALDRIVRRCLEKDRDQRFQSAAGLVVALQATTILVPNGGPKRRTWRKWAALAGAASAVALFFWLTRPLPPPHVTGMVQITSDNRPKGMSPPFSSDGSRLFFWVSSNEPAYQVSVRGGESVPLTLQTKGRTQILDINPDRTEFLVCRYVNPACELWVEPMLGGSPRRLGSLAAYYDGAAWSPDGQQLVYAGLHELRLARSDGTDVRQVAPVAGNPFFLRWSPDGRRIRFSLSSSGQPDRLWEVLLDGTGLHPLFSGWNPRWSTCCGNWTPDGSYFVFQANNSIWALPEKESVLRRSTHEPVRLDTGQLAALYPLPNADGKRVFFEGRLRRNEFLRYNLDSGRFDLEFPNVSGSDLEFSPDEKLVTYVSVPEGLLFKSAVDGSQRLQLTSHPLRASMPRWSPDGKQIAFVGSHEGELSRIYLVSSDGSALRRLTNGESGQSGDEGPSWSPDGSSLAFGADLLERAGEGSIHIVDLKTNHVSALPGSGGMWSPCWSPDGRFLAGLSGVGRKLLLYDFRAHSLTGIYDLDSRYPNWSKDGESLFFYSVGETSWLRFRMRDRKIERVNSLKNTPLAGWGWFKTAPNNTLITARNIGTDELYALEWDAP